MLTFVPKRGKHEADVLLRPLVVETHISDLLPAFESFALPLHTAFSDRFETRRRFLTRSSHDTGYRERNFGVLFGISPISSSLIYPWVGFLRLVT